MTEPGRADQTADASGEEFVIEVDLDDGDGVDESLRATGDELRQTGRELGDQARQQARVVKERAREKADELKQRATERANETKATASDKVASIAAALHAAGAKLEQDGEDGLGRMTHEAAEQVDRFTRYLRDNDVRGLMQDVESMSRGNPAVLMGSTFGAGMLLGRFLRSSSPDQESSADDAERGGLGSDGSGPGDDGYGPGFGSAAAPDASFPSSGGAGADDRPGVARSRGRIDMEVDR